MYRKLDLQKKLNYRHVFTLPFRKLIHDKIFNTNI